MTSLLLLLVLLMAPEEFDCATLEPTPATGLQAGTLGVHLVRTAGGAQRIAAWPAEEERAWLFVRAGGGQENLAGVPVDSAGQRALLARPPTGGDVALVGLDLRPVVRSVPAARLRAFLLARAGGGELPEGEASLRVRRIESAKLLLRSGVGRTSSAVAQSKTGQRVELRPLADPTTVPAGSVLPLRVYAPGRVEGLTLTARHPASGDRRRFETRPGGVGHFTVSAPGRWIVEAHVARPLPAEEGVDWELASATLVFDAMEGQR